MNESTEVAQNLFIERQQVIEQTDSIICVPQTSGTNESEKTEEIITPKSPEI